MKRFWCNNGIEERLVRSEATIPEGFTKGRLKQRKSKTDLLCERFSKDLVYDKYITQNMPFNELLVEFGIEKNELHAILSRYKITKSSKARAKNNHYVRDRETIKLVAEKSSRTQKERWASMPSDVKLAKIEKLKKRLPNNTPEQKQKAIEKRRDTWFQKSALERERINKKRSVSCKEAYIRDPTISVRKHQTEIKNRAIQKQKLCRTIAEQKMYDKLITIYSDLQYDVLVDSRYPYFCDFYIPSIDLFIELQAHPSHGRLPINYLSVDEYSKYPHKWVDVFAKRDVDKYNTAVYNKLNFIRIYPTATLQENIMINNDSFTDIVTLCYLTQ